MSDVVTDHRQITSHASATRVVRVLVAARVVNRLGAFTLPFLTVLMTTELDASIGVAGLVMTVFGLATIPSRLAGGRLADRLGARRTIVLGLTGCALCQLWLATADSIAVAFVAAALLGLVFEIYEPPSQALIAELVPPRDRPAAYGLLGAALAVAAVGAGLLASLLIGVGLRWLFVADAVTCLGCALLVGLLLPGGHTRQQTEARVWRDRGLLTMLAVGIVFATVYLQLMTVLPLTLQTRGLPLSGAGLVFAVSAVTMIAAQPLTRLIQDDFRAMTIGYAVLAAGLFVTALADSLAILLAATVVWSIGDLILLGRTQSVVAELAPPGARGRYLATYGTCWGIAAAIGPFAGTQLLTRSSPTTLWLTCAAVTAALATAQPLISRVAAPRPGDPVKPESPPAPATADTAALPDR